MIKNAKITSTFFGYEDHRILTFYITVDGGGWGVSIGGYALDSYSKELEKRIPSENAMSILTEILKVVGVSTWEELKGQYIRVEDNGLGKPIKRLGNLLSDDWLDIEEYFRNK